MSRKRLNLAISPKAGEALEYLRRETGSSASKVCAQALSIYRLVAERSLDGATIHLVDPDGNDREVVILFD